MVKLHHVRHTVASLLSKALGVPARDTRAVLEAGAGVPVTGVAKRYGATSSLVEQLTGRGQSSGCPEVLMATDLRPWRGRSGVLV